MSDKPDAQLDTSKQLTPDQHLAQFLKENDYRIVVILTGPATGAAYSLLDFIESGQPIPRGWPVQYLVEKRQQNGDSPGRSETRPE